MAYRGKRSQNWARGILAGFWILLAGLSGLYLFSAFNDPTLGGQLIGFVPQASGETTSAVFGNAARDRELAEIKQTLRELTQQVAALNAQLKPEVPEPGASTPEPSEDAQPKTASAENAPPVGTPAEVKPTTDAPMDAPKPETSGSAAKPVEQAALDQGAPAVPSEQPASAEEPADPPQVAVSPLEPPADEAPQGGGLFAPTAGAGAIEAAAEPAEAEQPKVSPAPMPAAEAEPDRPETADTAALDPVALPPAANDGTTRYGIEIGSVAKQDALRPLWREYLTNHAALVAGLQPRRVLAPDKKWRLIAGPFSSADEAEQACALFKKASRPCEATVYAGDAL